MITVYQPTDGSEFNKQVIHDDTWYETKNNWKQNYFDLIITGFEQLATEHDYGKYMKKIYGIRQFNEPIKNGISGKYHFGCKPQK